MEAALNKAPLWEPGTEFANPNINLSSKKKVAYLPSAIIRYAVDKEGT